MPKPLRPMKRNELKMAARTNTPRPDATITSARVKARTARRSMHGIIIVIEAVLSITGEIAHGMEAPVGAMPGGGERNFFHVRFQIADDAGALKASRRRAEAGVNCHGSVARILQRLELGPVFQSQAFHLIFHDLRRGGEVAGGVDRLETALHCGHRR